MSTRTICVVGNPNCGKTTLFNALTGSKQSVGNWPGVTVEKKTGAFTHQGTELELVDLPGIYSITPSSSSGEDERVARDYILTGQAEAVINIVDASNLERNLYLTAQLIEMRVPMMIVVNMLDIAKQHRLEVKLQALEKALGVPVIGVVANRSKGLKELKDAILNFIDHPKVPPMQVEFPARISEVQAQIEVLLAKQNVKNPGWFANQLLEQAPGIEDKLQGVDLSESQKIVHALNDEFDGDLDIEIANARYGFVSQVAEEVIVRHGEMSATLTDRIDRIVLNRWLGLPIFLFIMYVMFLFTQSLGKAFTDFFDILVGGILIDGFGGWLQQIGCPDWLRVILSNGIGGGIQTISTFIPVVFFLYLFLSFLEDSGYMARAAFVMDRLMRALGLPGKAFVPLIVGFGCNVPAIMATRTMDRASDRIITVLMSPFMSCSARLPVYVLFATAFWPTHGQNIVFALYLTGILAAILTGFLLKRTALPGAASAFVMEIPPYHIPTFKGIMLRTWDRMQSFLFRAGQVIVVIVAVLSFFNSLGTDGSFGNEDSEKSVLSAVSRTVVPVLEPMGVERDNWPAAVGIVTGVFAKEAVVGTLNSLYSTINAKPGSDAAEGDQADEPWSLSATFKEACDTTVDNIKGLTSAFTDPIGLGVGDLSDEKAAAEEQDVSTGTIDSIKQLFGSSSAAFAYLLMVLLYMPCVAAIAAVYREIGPAWCAFAAAWTTVLGYSTATVFYRIANFSANPTYAITCFILVAVVISGMYFWMKAFAKRDAAKGPKVIPINPRR